MFGRTLDGVALLAEMLAGHDALDPLTRFAVSDAPLPPPLA